jgi:hypothetical protein
MQLGDDSEFNSQISYKVPVNYPPAFIKIVGAASQPKEKGKLSYLGVIETLAK